MNKRRPTSNEMAFYIVGHRRLGNELVADYLCRKTGNDCFVLENIQHISKSNTNNSGRSKLIFWDCRKKDLKNLLTELRAYNVHDASANHMVLFNMSNGMAMNKKLVVEGIRGIFYEHDSLDHFMKGVKAVIEGKLWLSREVMTQCIFEESDAPTKSTTGNLTERQTEILALIAVGASNDEIADRLCISLHTVKTHLYRIFKEINVPNRVQAALWAAANL
jgi:LuxR family transcriptional regulator of csgAB operon